MTQIGFAARLLLPVYQPRTFLSPGYQDNLGWGFATALGAQDARRDVPVVAISGDGGFLYSANELASAMHHRIPLVTIVFNDDAFGNVRRIQAERYGNRLIASDLTNPDFRALRREFWGESRAGAFARGAAGGAAARPCPARSTQCDRGAGRGDAEPVGVHSHAARARTAVARMERLLGRRVIRGALPGLRRVSRSSIRATITGRIVK